MERELLRAIPAEIGARIDEGYLHWREGRLGAAQAALEAALARAAATGNVAGILSVRHLLGNLAYDRGDMAEAREHHLFVLAESESLGIAVGVASSLHNLGLALAGAGEATVALTYLRAAADRYERLAMAEAAALVRANLARIEAGAQGRGGHGQR